MIIPALACCQSISNNKKSRGARRIGLPAVGIVCLGKHVQIKAAEMLKLYKHTGFEAA